ncbi:chromosome segregation protein SMC [Gracilibacillus marinus]|uniref:Chromosome partition protein Smc n=1 Tax=Gracilibacillus marinus TaxID=630535 RepID=A0ABV8VWH8_9BACI
MYLQQIDTIGFKSFAERIKVDFVQGVTAVVGPNGSGKSNITDAIRWVLGEQSAKSLRGSKMEDIIFQGSENRKALNMAEVTLVLNNSDGRLPVDYKEVSVTRRVYRSGESEFLINKQSCRLKDITDLFLDSGLGREAFSIISQGKVEEILSSKSEERRIIFEEAAGVLKYKNRKKQAEYKLAETQENLNRVEDIIYEISGQLAPLEEQASIAKEYVSHKERLTEVEVGLLVKEITLFDMELTNAIKEIEQWKEAKERINIQANEKNNELLEQKKKLQQTDDTIQQLQDKLLEWTKSAEHLEGNKKIYHERLQHYSENKNNLELEISKLDTKIQEYKQLMQVESEKLKQLTTERKDTKIALDKIVSQLSKEKSTLEEDIESHKSDYIDLLNQQAAKRNEQTSIQNQLNRMKGKEDLHSTKWDDSLKQRKELEQSVNTYEEKLEKLKVSLEEMKCEVSSIEKKISVETNLVTDMEQKYYKGLQMIENLKSKKELLEDLKEDFQGFYAGVKEVLKARENNVLQGIHGAIPELVTFDDLYIDAMETALGAQAQHIVMENEKNAREAINWLKRTNKGRATFLPLTTMQSKSIPQHLFQQIKNEEGFIGIGSDLAQYDKKYEQVMKALLGNVIIAKTLKDANNLAAMTNRRYRIVTLEGDIVNPGGSMSGGAKQRKNQSLFTRERELSDINEKYIAYQKRIEDFEQQLHNQKTLLKELKIEQNEKQTNLTNLLTNYQNEESTYKEVKLSLEHLNQRLSIYDQDKLQQQEERNELVQRSTIIEKELSHIGMEISQIDEKVMQLTKELEEFELKEALLKQSHQELQIKFAELNTKLTNQKEKVEQVTNELNELYLNHEDKNDQLSKLEHVKKANQTPEEMNRQIQEVLSKVDETKLQLQVSRDQRFSIQQLIETIEIQIKNCNNEEQVLMEELQKVEIKKNRLEIDLDQRLDLLQHEYVMTFEKAKRDFKQPDDLEEAKEKVKLIKRAIDELGTVNLGAIDEYERIKERYDFLTKQQEDLVQAKRTLYEIIAEMDEEMTSRFSETFHQIKDEFSIVFQKLFGGGKAELCLTDPNHMLTTGVDIIAQPPGKKLQQLGLLSGGERALTAIALLFAILRIRPVPFCVLDEVEAALDEANVTRFATYLKKYSSDTQFIVITHRKGTMEEADVLYGVTMQESGVSRLVSVKLEETEELLEV